MTEPVDHGRSTSADHSQLSQLYRVETFLNFEPQEAKSLSPELLAFIREQGEVNAASPFTLPAKFLTNARMPRLYKSFL
jgi:hypothetical protein